MSDISVEKEILESSKDKLDTSSKNKLYLAIFLFSVGVFAVTLTIYNFHNNQDEGLKELINTVKAKKIDMSISLSKKKNAIEDQKNKVRDAETRCKNKRGDYNIAKIKNDRGLSRGGVNVVRENDLEREEKRERKNQKEACDKQYDEERKLKKQEDESFKLEYWVIDQTKKTESILYFGLLSSVIWEMGFSLLFFSGALIIFLQHGSDRNRMFLILDTIEQYGRFDLAHKHCLVLEEQEQEDISISGDDKLDLYSKLKEASLLWDTVNKARSEYHKNMEDQSKKDQYKKALKEAVGVDKDVLMIIKKMKISPKKSLQVRVDLIKAIYSYKLESDR